MTLAKTLEAAARDAIRAALVRANGNVRAAAAELDVPYSTLQRLITKLGLRSWLTEEYERAARQPAR